MYVDEPASEENERQIENFEDIVLKENKCTRYLNTWNARGHLDDEMLTVDCP